MTPAPLSKSNLKGAANCALAKIPATHRFSRTVDDQFVPEFYSHHTRFGKRLPNLKDGLVGAVGIEFTSLHSKSRKKKDVAPPP